MEINRSYNHKTHGHVGAVVLVAPKGKWTLDGKELPESSVEHLVTFALQTLQDAYAGASDSAEATANFAKKYAKLIDGTIGTRGIGSSRDDRTVAIINLMIASFDKETAKRFRALSGSDQVEKARENNESFSDKEIEAELGRIEAARLLRADRKNIAKELGSKVKISF